MPMANCPNAGDVIVPFARLAQGVGRSLASAPGKLGVRLRQHRPRRGPCDIPAATFGDRAALPRLQRRPGLFDCAAAARDGLPRRTPRHRQRAAGPAAVHAAGGLRCLRDRRALPAARPGRRPRGRCRWPISADCSAAAPKPRSGPSATPTPNPGSNSRTQDERRWTGPSSKPMPGLEGRAAAGAHPARLRGPGRRRLVLRRGVRRAAAHGRRRSTRPRPSSSSIPASISGRRSPTAPS